MSVEKKYKIGENTLRTRPELRKNIGSLLTWKSDAFLFRGRTLRYPKVGMEFGFFGSGLATLEKMKTHKKEVTLSLKQLSVGKEYKPG